jgi:hypothetical protein
MSISPNNSFSIFNLSIEAKEIIGVVFDTIFILSYLFGIFIYFVDFFVGILKYKLPFCL